MRLQSNWLSDAIHEAQAANVMNDHVHEALFAALEQAIATAGLPPLPERAPDEILLALWELKADMVEGTFEAINRTTVLGGLVEIVEMWRDLSLSDHAARGNVIATK